MHDRGQRVIENSRGRPLLNDYSREENRDLLLANARVPKQEEDVFYTENEDLDQELLQKRIRPAQGLQFNPNPVQRRDFDNRRQVIPRRTIPEEQYTYGRVREPIPQASYFEPHNQPLYGVRP